MKDLLNFKTGDSIVCVLKDHPIIAPCEICEVEKVEGDKLKLRGYKTLIEKNIFRIFKERDINSENTLEFNICGTLFLKGEQLTIDELSDEFVSFCESKGWQFFGITMPLSD